MLQHSVDSEENSKTTNYYGHIMFLFQICHCYGFFCLFFFAYYTERKYACTCSL